MGLSVVHGIVNAHGGIITVESEPGQGTTFRVCFPVIQCEQTDQKPTVSAPLPTGTERILLVDDEESLAGVLTTRLELQGYHVTCKSDGIDALAAFQCDPDQFDLLITDQSMPNVSGIELATEVMAIRPDLPVLLCTGFSTKVP